MPASPRIGKMATTGRPHPYLFSFNCLICQDGRAYSASAPPPFFCWLLHPSAASPTACMQMGCMHALLPDGGPCQAGHACVWPLRALAREHRPEAQRLVPCPRDHCLAIGGGGQVQHPAQQTVHSGQSKSSVGSCILLPSLSPGHLKTPMPFPAPCKIPLGRT